MRKRITQNVLGLLALLLSVCAFAQADKATFVLDAHPQAGFYDHAALRVSLLSLPNTQIYFTTDGNDPQETPAHRYTTELELTKTTVIRCFVVTRAGRSPVQSFTYFLQAPKTTFPVVSVSLPPDQLFDPNHGVLVKGYKAGSDKVWYQPSANFWSRVELPASTEFYAPSGKLKHSGILGFRVFGGMSRLFPQKSFALVASDDRYTDRRIDYDLFGKDAPGRLKSIVARNSGSDWGRSNFRDVLMTQLVKDWDLDVQAFRPAHIYLNGQYWGMYNLREKINRFFINDHHPIDKDSLDIMEHQRDLKFGSRLHYEAMIDFLKENDLADNANFEYLKTLMEVENYTDHQLAQIYFDNRDAGGNIRYWRPQTEEGRWRWILYDTDWGFGLHTPNSYASNSLKFHTQADGPVWPNPEWSTLILRKLLENENYRQQFVVTALDHLNTSLHEDTVRTKIAELEGLYRPEIKRHFDRWDLSMRTWEREVKTLYTFGCQRNFYLRKHLAEHFGYTEESTLTVNRNAGGAVRFNKHYTWDSGLSFVGTYFRGVPIRLEAQPQPGYRFVHWLIGGEKVANRELVFQLPQEGLVVEAVFEAYVHPLAGKIVINEICSKSNAAGDWLELYNLSEHTVSLENWLLEDRKNSVQLPKVIIPSREYLILTRDSLKFWQRYPSVYNTVQGLPFGLHKRAEELRLYSGDGAYIDSVGYWIPPQDSAFTLSLLLPYLDNADDRNWEIRTGHGTPNSANPYYVESVLQSSWKDWMQIGMALGVLLSGILLLYLRHIRIL